MRTHVTIWALVVVGFLGLASTAWAAPDVTPPPGAPGWWNEECIYYAYGWWSADIIAPDLPVSPPDNSAHWASNFLSNTAFVANIGVTNDTIAVDLDNVFRPDLYKEIFVYISGTTSSTVENVDTLLDTDGGVFTGTQTWTIDAGNWVYILEGEIHPQPDYVGLRFTVPGMTSVTNIWAGENCVPEPATLSLLALGGLAMLRRRRK